MSRSDLNDGAMTRKARIQLDFNFSATGLDIHYACIPWSEHERIYKENYAPEYGLSQSAERINERGGFGVMEAIRLGYDNPLVIWVAGRQYPNKDSDWTKLALKFDLKEKTCQWRILSECDYKSLDLFEQIKDSYNLD